MDIEQARFNMVAQQLRPAGVLDEMVLDAMLAVRRELFVPPALRHLAFAGVALPLSNNQFMLMPEQEGLIVQALAPRRGERVLEIGCGSGFMAALLAECGARVTSLEINPQLAARARENLAHAAVDRVEVIEADGAQGWPDDAPYDAILVSGGLTQAPPAAWFDQLKPGGRLLACVGPASLMQMKRFVRLANGVQEQCVFETILPPLQLGQSARFEL